MAYTRVGVRVRAAQHHIAGPIRHDVDGETRGQERGDVPTALRVAFVFHDHVPPIVGQD